MLQNNDIQQKTEEISSEAAFKELIEAGVFYGRKKTKCNPKMKPYILGIRNDFTIINLKKTLEKIEEASIFLKEKIRSGANILLVGTHPASRYIKDISLELNLPFINNRWIGGLLTNFEVISQRIKFLKKLRENIQGGMLEKYTKKERLKIMREFNKLEEMFSSIENLNELPQLLIVIDPQIHSTAVQEANKLKIPIIAFANTDTNPELIDILVCGNTLSSKSVNWFLEKIKKAIQEARLEVNQKIKNETTGESTFSKEEQVIESKQ